METINHECYVSLEVAKLLKDTGFDWECKEYYYNFATTGWSLSFDDNFVNWNSWSERYISAPTLDVAQRWLREVKNIDINILTDFDSVKRLYYVRYVVKDGHYKTYYITKNQSYVYFNTYEEAQEAGINEALEILLEKGE